MPEVKQHMSEAGPEVSSLIAMFSELLGAIQSALANGAKATLFVTAPNKDDKEKLDTILMISAERQYSMAAVAEAFSVYSKENADRTVTTKEFFEDRPSKDKMN